jgi:hypothetical protein
MYLDAQKRNDPQAAIESLSEGLAALDALGKLRPLTEEERMWHNAFVGGVR